MGVLRFPRPVGIYIPYSSSQTLTTDMISPPLSPGDYDNSETIVTSTMPALEYISSKLQQKLMHVTLLVGRGAPMPASDEMMVIPVTSLNEADNQMLQRTVAKAVRKFGLGNSWTEALSRSQHERDDNAYLVQQSIRQNDVLFSREGLTLLSMDRIYTFKRRLCILSRQAGGMSQDAIQPYITSCVQLLHRTITDFQGRTFSKALFHRVYKQLDIDDQLLTRVARAYREEYGQDGIVTPQPAAQQPRRTQTTTTTTTNTRREHAQEKTVLSRTAIQRTLPRTQTMTAATTTSTKARRPLTHRRGPPPTSSNSPRQIKRGPKTPLSASDVTPVTQGEWNFYMACDKKAWAKPTVTKWTPSPTVLVGV